MRGLDRRLADLERAAPTPATFAIYQEDLDYRGMFRRGAGWRGRDDLPPLLTRDQVRDDAAGATVILIEYEDHGSVGSIDFGPDATALYLPNSHREGADDGQQ